MSFLLGCLPSLAASCACCAGSSAFQLLRCNGRLNSSTATRVAYAFSLLLTSIVAWVMESDWIITQLDRLAWGYLKLNCPENSCYGTLAVYRLMFASSLYHTVLALVMIGQKDSRGARGALQNGYWGPKFLSVIALSVLAFFIPNGFFMFWGSYIALAGAAVFVLFQMFLLVDFAHSIAESLLERWETTEEKKWMFLLAGGTLLGLLSALAMTIVAYIFFGPSGCQLNQTLISLNLVFSLAVAAVSVHPEVQAMNPKSGLAQATIVIVYATYLILSALANEPVDLEQEPICNLVAKSGGFQTSTIVVGAMITFLSVAWSTTRAASNRLMLPEDGDGQGSRAALFAAVESGALPASALDEDEDEDDDKTGQLGDDEKNGTAYSYSFFHATFALAACYVSMLVTNWNTVSSSEGLTTVGTGWASVWVRTVTNWIVLLLYTWTLLGPVLLPDREFY